MKDSALGEVDARGDGGFDDDEDEGITVYLYIHAEVFFFDIHSIC